MRFADRPPQRLPAVGDQDQMDMIGHQAVGPDRDTMLAALLTQQIAIEFVVGIGEKHVLAPISALGDMMGQTGNDETSDAGHEVNSGTGKGDRHLNEMGV